MIRFVLSLVFLVFLTIETYCQKNITYYLPDIEYDSTIPTPESVFGFQIGEWHLSHDQLMMYMKILANSSPRVTLHEYARSYEQRPLIYLTITSEENHQQIEAIQANHLAISNPTARNKIDLREQPSVVYQGFSIHGNEASGGNAAPLVAYYLAAGKSPEVLSILKHTVILLDPCFNPDGFQRFSTWVNMHKNEHLIAANEDREYHEVWPGGRTNHYWFDLNRDWLLLQHPESRGRIEIFHKWKPNILTDHHEMGTNRTFFFMPGIPQRTNPITPALNQELTRKVGLFHANALDEIGSLYYNEESFDDFYYGKGSTYPDANACIGILFEQASARGHLQKSENGFLSFPFAIRNQVRTALSTQRAGVELREELLVYQQDFYETALKEADDSKVKAYVFGGEKEKYRTTQLVQLLQQHQIEVYPLKKGVEVNGKKYVEQYAFVVPTKQPQYRLVRGVFEQITAFNDSIFYDVSSWVLPLAFDLPYDALNARLYSKQLLNVEIDIMEATPTSGSTEYSDYAYLLEWEHYQSPKVLFQLMSKGLRAKVATKPFEIEGKSYAPGTVMIAVQNQSKPPAQIYNWVLNATNSSNATLTTLKTGYSTRGIDLGSPSFKPIRLPRVLLVVGKGVNSYQAGEVWHLLDQRYGIPVSKVEWNDMRRIALHNYTTIIMVNGSYVANEKTGENIRQWVQSGGTLLAIQDAAAWAKKIGVSNASLKTYKPKKEKGLRAYELLDTDQGSKRIGGAIVNLSIDRSHPLFYGFQRDNLPALQRGSNAFNLSSNPYATPARYKFQPLLSGYIKKELQYHLRGAGAVLVSGYGSGKVICFSFNPNFRAFWYGTNRLFANSIFFGNVINSRAVDLATGKRRG